MFGIESPAFKNGERIPSVYTCDGEDVSPALVWQNPPQGTKSLAIICDDPDAPMGTWVHWIIYEIPPEVTRLEERVPKVDTLPGGIKQGINSWNKIGYGGPCPPAGKPHRYFFKLYALDRNLGGSLGLTKEGLLQAMEGHVVAKAELIGLYSR